MSSLKLRKAVRIGFGKSFIPSQNIPSSCESAVADPLFYLDDSPPDRQHVAVLLVSGQHMTCCADSTAIAGHQRHFSVVLSEIDAH